MQLNYKTIHGNASEGLGGVNKSVVKEKIYLLDTLYFSYSPYTTHHLPIRTTPNGLNMLGLGFFKKYRTTLSCKEAKLILEPYDSVQSFIWKTAGFSTKYDVDLKKVIVKNITENSPASRAEVPLYAEVISINDHVFTDEASLCNYYNEKIDGDSLFLKVKDHGVPKEYNLAKQPIFSIGN